MRSIARADLAHLSGMSEEGVEALVGLGILEPTDGSFRPSDVQITRIVRALNQAGISAEQIAALIQQEEFSFAMTETAFPNPPTLSSKSVQDVADELAVPIDLLLKVYGLSGLPIPEPDDPVREDDAEGLGTVALVYKTLGGDKPATLEPSRHLGENLRRIAESQVRFFKVHLEQPMLNSGLPYGRFMDKASELSGSFIPASVTALNWLYRRHLEYYIMQEIIEATEAAMERCGMTAHRAKKAATIAFLDLTSYTSLTEERGDEIAADIATRLSDVIREAATRYGGQAVKFLGDGVMFYFPEPGGAVRSGLDLVDEVPRLELPPARMGVTAGPVVFRDGDYFGRTVNIAARITDYARPREVLVSEDVVTASEPPGVSYVPVGPVSLKGIQHPTPLYLAKRQHSLT